MSAPPRFFHHATPEQREQHVRTVLARLDAGPSTLVGPLEEEDQKFRDLVAGALDMLVADPSPPANPFPAAVPPILSAETRARIAKQMRGLQGPLAAPAEPAARAKEEGSHTFQ